LDASLQILDGGGARVVALEVLNKGGVYVFLALDTVGREGVDPLFGGSLYHQGEA
jgi:hypothetical protein